MLGFSAFMGGYNVTESLSGFATEREFVMSERFVDLSSKVCCSLFGLISHMVMNFGTN